VAKLGGKIVVKGLAGAGFALVVSAAACSSDGGGSAASTAGNGGSQAEGGSGSEMPEGGNGDTGGSMTGSSGAVTGGSAGSAVQTNGGAGGEPSPPAAPGGAGGEAGAYMDPLGAGGWESVQGDPPIDPNCGDYEEVSDRTNNNAGEHTDITVNAGTVTICGRLDAYHFVPRPDVPGYGSVDDDTFFVKFVGDAEYEVSLEILGAGVPEYTDLHVSPQFGFAGYGAVQGQTAATWIELSDGVVPITVNAVGAAPLKGSLPYKLRIRRDSPKSRCPAVAAGSATQKYVEAKDGANNTGNDVIRYVFQAPEQKLTTSTADAPEPTAIVLKPGDHSLIQGSSAQISSQEDYADVDMYAFTTGASGVLTARLDWTGNKTDLDLMLFSETKYQQQLAYSASYDAFGPELFTFHVQPQTKYWLYVAGAATSAVLPMAYNVTLCGEAFTP
jgi:hypothetical protein